MGLISGGREEPPSRSKRVLKVFLYYTGYYANCLVFCFLKEKEAVLIFNRRKDIGLQLRKDQNRLYSEMAKLSKANIYQFVMKIHFVFKRNGIKRISN